MPGCWGEAGRSRGVASWSPRRGRPGVCDPRAPTTAAGRPGWPGWEPVRASPGGAGDPSSTSRPALPAARTGPPRRSVYVRCSVTDKGPLPARGWTPAGVRPASGGAQLGEPSPCRRAPSGRWPEACQASRFPGRPAPLPAAPRGPGWPLRGPALARSSAASPDPRTPAGRAGGGRRSPRLSGLSHLRVLSGLGAGRRAVCPPPPPVPRTEWPPPPLAFVSAFSPGRPAAPQVLRPRPGAL